MADSKTAPGAQYPIDAVASEYQTGEPLIGPEELVRLHLFGIPLVSAIRDPITRHAQRMTPEDLKFYIDQAVGLAGLELGMDLFSADRLERHPYDRPAQNSFGYMVLRQRPVYSVTELAVVSSDGQNIWNVPLEWIETGLLHTGQLNLVPFAIAGQSGVTIPFATPAGQGLLPSMFSFPWVPALWQVSYRTGYPAGKLPKFVNQLIGVIAAMEVLSMLATTYARVNSASLSIDGLSQSQSLPGAQIFVPRLQDLAAKRKWLVSKIKRLYSGGMWADNV